jgi:hypothetical protein
MNNTDTPSKKKKKKESKKERNKAVITLPSYQLLLRCSVQLINARWK